MDAVNSMFNADKITSVSRGEWEYYQFDESTPTGEAVVVRMRPNGDILKVGSRFKIVLRLHETHGAGRSERPVPVPEALITDTSAADG